MYSWRNCPTRMSYVKWAIAITVLSSSFLILVEISLLHHQVKRSSLRYMNGDLVPLQMCESNQTIRLKHAQMYKGSLKDCLFSNCYTHLLSNAIPTLSDRTKTCIKTVVETCSEHKGTFTSSNMCVRYIKDDHSKIAVRNSSDIFVAVRTCSSNHGSRLSLQMLTWMQLIHEPRQVC